MWEGSTEYEAQVKGRAGGLVRLGNTVVPRRVALSKSGSHGSPDIVARFEIRDGRPECVEVSVKAGPNGRGIRMADLDEVLPIDQVAAHAFERYARKVETVAPNAYNISPLTGDRDEWQVRKDLGDAAAKPGRRVSDAELADVARVYRAAAEQGAPLKQVEIQLGYSRRTAARRVALAKEKGLL